MPNLLLLEDGLFADYTGIFWIGHEGEEQQ